MKRRGKKIFSLLASILEYPTARIADQANQAIELLESVSHHAMLPLERFRDYCVTNPTAVVQSVYVRTFDIDGYCCPYVGHHLFGDNRSRILFAAKLKELFPAHVAARKERPDHIAQILRSLVVQESVEEADELVRHCLIPAVKKMIARFNEVRNPYRSVLQAVLLTLMTEQKQSSPEREQEAEYAMAGGGKHE